MIPHLLLWSMVVCAMVFSLTAIIWTIYAAYNRDKVKILPNSNNNMYGPNETGTLLSGNGAHLPVYESNKMENNTDIEEFLKMRYIYSIDSDSDSCCTSDEEVTELKTIVEEKISRHSSSTDLEDKICRTSPTTE